MPGILCSVYDLNDHTIGPKWRRSLKLVQYHPKHILEQYSELGFQLACLYHPEVCQGPRILVSEQFVLAYYGNICEDESTSLPNGETLCRFLLNRFLKHGIDALQNLNGRYNIAIWNRHERILYFISDRFGANRHYYLQKPSSLHIACEVKSLVVELDQIKIDPAGLASMLMFGYHIGDLTIFQDVKYLPNAHHLKYYAVHGQLSIGCYWNYPYGEKEPLLGTETELAETLHTRLTTALKRQLRGVKSILLPISGGLDSRTLAGLLAQSKFSGEVLAYSYGQPSSRDVRYGRAIAKELGYKHITIPTPPDFMVRYMDEDSWRFDAEWSAELSWGVRYTHTHPILNSAIQYPVLSGMFGDLVLGSDRFGYRHKAGDIPLSIDRLREIYYLCNQEYGPNQRIFEFLEPIAASQAKKTLDQIINATLLPIAGQIPYYVLMRAEFEHRQRRHTSMVAQCIEQNCQALTPFLDIDVVEFAMRLPFNTLYGKKIYKQMIRNHLPVVAKIPYASTGLPLTHAPLREAVHWRLEGILRRFPWLQRQLTKRNAFFNFHSGIMRQKAFFEQQAGALRNLAPPLNFELALEHYRCLLEGRTASTDQVCAFLPPVLFIHELNQRINQVCDLAELKVL